MQCPVCGKPTRAADRDCEACGELLTPWRTIEFYGSTLRQRGLALATQGDHLGAMISFLEGALANPLDGLSRVDAARALVHLNRLDDAERLLADMNRPEAQAAAAALKAAIDARRQQAAQEMAADQLASEQAETASSPPVDESGPTTKEQQDQEEEPIMAAIVEDDPPAQ